MFEQINNDEIIFKFDEFATNLNKQLYVVGGAVRDELMGLKRCSKVKDFDLTGELNLKEVLQFIENNNLNYEIKNLKLEVVSFWLNDDVVYEYARMRSEEYRDINSHNPSNIWFVDSIEEDVKRRDFSINSVYYVRHNTSVIDPLNAVNDIANGIIKTVASPNETLSVDPARIFRFIELASRLNFKVDDQTLMALKDNSHRVYSLSKNRIKKEMNRILEVNKYEGWLQQGYLSRVEFWFQALGLDFQKMSKFV